MEKIIDCKGMACPLPVVNAKKASEELKAGDVLTVLVDNEIAVQNLTRFGEHKGYSVSAEKKAEKEYAVIMTVSGAASAETQEEEIACVLDQRKDFCDGKR
jgi:TusA-related sulfurtransferase